MSPLSARALLLAVCLTASSLFGQDAAAEIAELKKLIAAQKLQLQQQEAQLAAIEKRLAAAAPVVAAVAPAPAPVAPEAKPLRWFEKYSVRGYTQLRTNRIATNNSMLLCEQCDRSIGVNSNLFMRRVRFVVSGDVNDRISIYFQPDFASTAGNLHFGQIRDLYFDVALDKKKEFRFRFGQSKIPYGFENLQSSSNRIAFDRSDPINSVLTNERDLAALFYWAPAHIRKRFAQLTNSHLKGSGDYGVIGVGVYNGQTANRPEANNNLHRVARFTYPWQLKNGRFIEAGVQALSGRYAITNDQRSPGVLGPSNFKDQRAAASFILYPQPFGIQTEYNFGTGPQYNPRTRTIESHSLKGGYFQTTYMYRRGTQSWAPYFRYQYYQGGKKHELDARRYLVRSGELGMEWQPNPFMEWTAEFVNGDRTYEDFRTPNNRQQGSLLRLQLQINY